MVHLNCHSYYSLLRGVPSVEALVETAGRLKFDALALTDTNATYGAVAFQKAAQSASIRPIFGAEIDDPNSGAHAVLLAKTLGGFGEICRVITDRKLNTEFSLPARLKNCNDEIIIMTPDLGVVDTVARARGSINLGIEHPLFGSVTNEIARWEFSREHKIPLIASNRVHFLKPEDFQTHRLLTAMRLNKYIDAVPNDEMAHPKSWLKSDREIRKSYWGCPQAVRNTIRIAEQCDMTLPIGQLQFPPFTLPDGTTPEERLRSLAEEGVKRLYTPITRRVLERLEYELSIIGKMDFSSYFLLVEDIVREAHARGIPTVGRGSAANSLVCRALSITEVDPIENNLYFERFLHEQREDFPDIDIDFPWNRRDEMIQYVFDKYGEDHVALISTHTHLRGRSTLREVAKAMGVPEWEINKLTSKLPHSVSVANLEAVCNEVPECRDLPLEDEPYKSVIEAAQKIEGIPRHISIHCGGLIVSPEPITNLIPLQKTPKGFAVTQYDMYPVEDMGLLKIDLLAQRGLAVEVDAVQAVKDHYGEELDFSVIDPVEDKKTRELVRAGNTMGCFYIESPGMQNLLKKLQVDTFERLTAASSIIRPGVAESGMMQAYIKRHNGKEAITYLHPKLEEVLKETYGIMIYQEDVIKVAHAIAGMSLGEAEGLRKCMSKKRDWERMETYRNRFLDGAKENRVSEDIRNEIWRQIESFAGYSFCKAHSASFAMVSYRAAYLKAHFPAEFMAAVLTNEGGFYDACSYTEETRRLGLEILPPHINHSRYEFFAERRDAIRVGLMQVRSLSRNGINQILEQREYRLFKSLEDFLERSRLDQTETESLIHCGALDDLGPSRPSMLWNTLSSYRKRRKTVTADQTGFSIESEPRACLFPEIEDADKVAAEIEVLALSPTSHPLSLFGIDQNQWPKGITKAKHLNQHRRKYVTLLGMVVTYKITRTGKGELMKFVTLEDPTGTFEVTLFPKTYQRFSHLFNSKGPFVVKGQVEEDSGARTVTAQWLGQFNPQRLSKNNSGSLKNALNLSNRGNFFGDLIPEN